MFFVDNIRKRGYKDNRSKAAAKKLGMMIIVDLCAVRYFKFFEASRVR